MSYLDTCDECTECGLIFENSHVTCHGHQWCMPECPRCGGELKPAAEAPPAAT